MGDFFVFDTKSNQWNQPNLQGDIPSNRSVAFFAPLTSSSLFLFGGEADPSDKGHEGGGEYHGDSYILDVESMTWRCIHGETKSAEDTIPVARGWLNGTACGENQVAIFGGFDGKLRRDDMFIWQ